VLESGGRINRNRTKARAVDRGLSVISAAAIGRNRYLLWLYVTGVLIVVALIALRLALNTEAPIDLQTLPMPQPAPVGP
jgi:hypothetical protein